jgi:Ala-tRNA(Pro) deacylase
MIVLPASHRINLELLKEVLSREGQRVEDERELKELFPDYETEIVSSSSKIKYFPVYVYFASPLSDDKEIVFNAGSFNDVMM